MILKKSGIDIEKSTVPFRDFKRSDIASDLCHAKLIAFGENPHSVAEYYSLYIEAIQFLLEQDKKVLILLEYPYWHNYYLDDYFEGHDEKFLEYTFYDDETSAIYGAGLKQFYTSVHALYRLYPKKVTCRHIDAIMTPLSSERIQIVESLDMAKWEVNKTIKVHQKQNEPEKWSELREHFMVSEAMEAFRFFEPNVMVLITGSFHARKKGGQPLNDKYMKSLTALISKELDIIPLSILITILDGQYAKLEYRDNKLGKIAVNCCEWGQEDTQLTYKNTVSNLSGDILITKLNNFAEQIKDKNDMYYDWISNHDYIVALRNGSADLSVKI
jgi:hypothetical protein